MDNQRYADLLEEAAKLMQIRNDSVFRVRAFERAARVVSGLADPVDDLLDAGTITDIKDIGKGIAAELAEYRERRTSATLDELRASLPAGIGELLTIHGLGPKRLRAIYEALGVGDLASLEAAAASGQLAELPGLGAKTVANIQKEIARLKAGRGRVPFAIARRSADEVLRALQDHPDVARIEIAGSLRRGRITVKDLDFVVASTNPSAVMDAFVAMPMVTEVSAKGETKSTVYLEGNLPCDLRVVPPEVFGATLHHFTGSKDHNIAMRQRALAKGLRISEYGVFERASDDSETPIACATEADIFAAVGLPWIAPELREDGGELEAAQAGTLPAIPTLADMQSDLHMHSTYSDGRASIEEMAHAAKTLGQTYLCITDHSQALGVANGLNRERLLAQMEEIDAVNARLTDFRVLKGLEVDILADGSIDMDDDVLAQLDWVIGSVHQWMTQPRATMTARIITAVRSGRISALGHPTGRLIGTREGFDIDLDAIFAACAESGVALEINASPERLDLDAPLLRRAQEDPRQWFTINSDAHSTRGLTSLQYGVMTARRGWLPASRILNTLPLEAFLRTRKKPCA